MSKFWQSIGCFFGYHRECRSYLKRADQRILIMACPCFKVVTRIRMTKEQAKSLRQINRKFGTLQLRD
jgi:hypothetical protein